MVYLNHSVFGFLLLAIETHNPHGFSFIYSAFPCCQAFCNHISHDYICIDDSFIPLSNNCLLILKSSTSSLWPDNYTWTTMRLYS